MQVLDPRAAPAIDRLVVVADDEGRAVGAGDELHPVVLDRVGVLELVDEHVTEALAVMREQRRVVAPELIRTQQQLGEIEDAGFAAGLFVVGVQLDELASRGVAVVLQLRRAQAFVLVGVDELLHFAGRPATLVEVLRLHHLLDEAALVFGVEDLEVLRQAGVAPVESQQPVRDAVEGADPHRRARHAEQFLDAAAHFGGGLVREGDGEDRMRRGVLDLDHPHDAMGEHPGLAAAGAGQYQNRANRGGYGLALSFVQRAENRGKVHEGAHSTSLEKIVSRRFFRDPNGSGGEKRGFRRLGSRVATPGPLASTGASVL